MTRTSTAWLLSALLFWLLNVSLHLEFSNWIVASYGTPFGNFIPRDHTPAIALTVILMLLAFVAWQAFRGTHRLPGIIAWCALFAGMYLAMVIITTTSVEMIHFLQYGMLAYLLAVTFDRDRSRWPLVTLMFMTVGLGIIDELNQYFWLTRPNSTYIDFNDFLLNQIGACAGLVARYGFRAPPAQLPAWGRLQSGVLAGYCLLGSVALLLWLSGHLLYRPDAPVPPGGIDRVDGVLVIFFERESGLLGSWQPTFSSGNYFVMGAATAIPMMALLVALLRGWVRLVRQSGEIH